VETYKSIGGKEICPQCGKKMGFFSKLFERKRPREKSEKIISTSEGRGTRDTKDMFQFTLLELSSPRFKNEIDARSLGGLEPLHPESDDDTVKQAYSLMQNLKWEEARRIIQDGLKTLNRKDRLCELLANIYLNEKNPVAIGWYMQSCVLGSPSWVPYLLVSYAARALGLDDIAWRCLNACDVIDEKRIDQLEKDIADIVKNSNRSELLTAMKTFEKTMDPYLPLSDELPHDQMERSTFLLQNITGDPEMPPLKQRLRLLYK
jgi:hypothetical protein